MPGYDRRGPMGEGPRTGGSRGFCVRGPEYGAPVGNRGNWGVGRGGAAWGGGRGRCFGGRGGFAPNLGRSGLESPVEETEYLKTQLAQATEEIAAMEARLAELEEKE